MAVAHYLEALEWQREFIKMHAILGGKNPHLQSFLVGGMATPVDPDKQASLNIHTIAQFKKLIAGAQEFVSKVYIPDLLAVASFYKDWGYGGGLAGKNMLSYGDFPTIPNQWDDESLMLPAGAIIDGDLSTVYEVDPRDVEQIQEFVNHSWYSYDDENRGLHPWEGVTEPNFELGPNLKGTRTRIEELDEGAKYSWLKAPRWKGHSMEVGPLARVLMLYASGHEPTQELAGAVLKQLDAPLDAMFSTLGRTAARTLETKIIADTMSTWLDKLLANIKNGDLDVHNEEMWDSSTWQK